jgi:hypothetical protein
MNVSKKRESGEGGQAEYANYKVVGGTGIEPVTPAV